MSSVACQGATKTCNHARSGLTHMVNGKGITSVKPFRDLLTDTSGQMLFLGLAQALILSAGHGRDDTVELQFGQPRDELIGGEFDTLEQYIYCHGVISHGAE